MIRAQAGRQGVGVGQMMHVGRELQSCACQVPIGKEGGAVHERARAIRVERSVACRVCRVCRVCERVYVLWRPFRHCVANVCMC